MPWVRGITFAKREKYLEEFELNDEAVDEVEIVIISPNFVEVTDEYLLGNGLMQATVYEMM